MTPRSAPSGSRSKRAAQWPTTRIKATAPMASVDWYFDFISPFAYLQSEQLTLLGPAVRVRYRPVLFAGLLNAHGHKGPAEIPRKRVFSYRFLVWQARRMGIAFKMPPEHPFNPLPLLRLAIACDCAPVAVHRIFRFVWRDGRLPARDRDPRALRSRRRFGKRFGDRAPRHLSSDAYASDERRLA